MVRSILILVYIVAVLLVSGLSQAAEQMQSHNDSTSEDRLELLSLNFEKGRP